MKTTTVRWSRYLRQRWSRSPTDSETTIAEATREYVVSLIENDPESFFEESTIESEVVETRREGSNSASEEANDD